MTDLQLDPAILKLVAYAKEKKVLSYEELSDYLPEHIANSDKIEEVLTVLEENNVQLIEDDAGDDNESESENRKPSADKKRVVSDKEASIDDPVKLYLKEIGREHLLTGDQEKELSKQMEEGENIIKGVIKRSGIIIREFYHIAQKASSKKDLKELNLSKKEITEYMTEKRRLNQFYKETLRLLAGDIKNYIDLKRRLINRGVNIFEDSELQNLRLQLMKIIDSAEIHPEEITVFSEKFIQAAKKIKTCKKDQERIEKHLKVRSVKDLRILGRSLTIKEERERIEDDLGLSADEIKDKIRVIQVNEKRLKQMEVEFEASIENINLMAKEINRGRGGFRFLILYRKGISDL